MDSDFESVVDRELLLEDSERKSGAHRGSGRGSLAGFPSSMTKRYVSVRIDGVLDGVKEIHGVDPFSGFGACAGLRPAASSKPIRASRPSRRVLWMTGEAYH